MPVMASMPMVGGNIRGATHEQLVRSLAEQPTMLALANALSEQQLEAISEYLQQLGEIPLVRLHLGEHHWQQPQLEAGEWVQFVVYNADLQPQELDLSALGLESVSVRARAEHSFMWQAEQGEFAIAQYLLTVLMSENKPK